MKTFFRSSIVAVMLLFAGASFAQPAGHPVHHYHKHHRHHKHHKKAHHMAHRLHYPTPSPPVR